MKEAKQGVRGRPLASLAALHVQLQEERARAGRAEEDGDEPRPGLEREVGRRGGAGEGREGVEARELADDARAAPDAERQRGREGDVP